MEITWMENVGTKYVKPPMSTSSVSCNIGTWMIDKLKPKTHVLGCPPRFCKGFLDGLPSPQLCGLPNSFPKLQGSSSRYITAFDRFLRSSSCAI
jgi:hypothetical protein